MTKASKTAVHYTDKAMNRNERCALCRHFEKPAGCKVVVGRVSPEGWCEEFERARTDR